MAHNVRGFAFLKLGRFDEAIDDYETALAASPKSAESLFGRGLARRKKGDTAAGNADIAAAKAIRDDVDKELAEYGFRAD